MEKIKFFEDSILIKEEYLVFSDLHLGYEKYIFGENLILRSQLKETLKKIDRVFRSINKNCIRKVIILGDLKHEFGKVSKEEFEECSKFLSYLKTRIEKNRKSNGQDIKDYEIILIKGNHDKVLDFVVKKENFKLKDFYRIGDFFFLHGDKLYKEYEKSKFLILGHLHPAIVLSNKYKKEKFKCFLKGKWKNREVIVLPSFMPLSLGYDLNLIDESKKDKFFVIDNKSLKNFEVLIYNNKENIVYNFGRLKKIKEYYFSESLGNGM